MEKKKVEIELEVNNGNSMFTKEFFYLNGRKIKKTPENVYLMVNKKLKKFEVSKVASSGREGVSQYDYTGYPWEKEEFYITVKDDLGIKRKVELSRLKFEMFID